VLCFPFFKDKLKALNKYSLVVTIAIGVMHIMPKLVINERFLGGLFKEFLGYIFLVVVFDPPPPKNRYSCELFGWLVGWLVSLVVLEQS
jgi:hypothetical protein